jgi:hypothetical protein
MLLKVDTEDKELIILADFNIDLMSDKIPLKWIHLKNNFNMSQIVSDPTRVTNSSSTLVDHVYSNQPENVDFISVPKYSINDHYPICISHKRELKNKKQFHDHITDRSMKMFKESDFNEHLSKCSFDSILEIDDPDEALLPFLNILTEVLNHHAPIIKRRVKYLQQNEWMNIYNKMRG